MAYPTSAFITHLVYLRDMEVAVDVQKITVREDGGGTPYLNRTYLEIGHGCEMHRGEWSARETV